MSKRKKKSSARNKFTDALSQEMSERKLVERINPAEVDTAAKVADVEEIPARKPVDLKKPDKPIEPEKIAVEEIVAVEEISTPPVQIDARLEERILKEADNDFYDDKLAGENSAEEKPPKKSIYRSKALQKWERERDEKNSPKNPVAQESAEQPHKLSHPEKAGIVIAVVMLIYAFATLDKPLFFMAMSLLMHFLRPVVGAAAGEYNQAAQNMLRTFSFMLFVGAVIFLFTG